MSLDQQLAVAGHDRRLVTWLIVTGRLRPTAEYLVASSSGSGRLQRGVHREFHGRFMAIASELGFDHKSGPAAMVGGRQGRGAGRRGARAADRSRSSTLAATG